MFEYVVYFFEVVGIGNNVGDIVFGGVVFLEVGLFVEIVYL